MRDEEEEECRLEGIGIFLLHGGQKYASFAQILFGANCTEGAAFRFIFVIVLLL